MNDPFRIYISNQIEMLYSALAQRLFDKTQNPFVKRVVVVPSPAMKSWLMLQLANDPDYEIALGLEVVYLDQAMSMIKKQYEGPDREGEKIPSHLDLALAIEVEIREILTSGLQSDHWKPLFTYLFKGDVYTGHVTSQVNKRLLSLSDNLATLFEKYGLFGGKFLDKGIDDWQFTLWQRIWQKRSHWNYPYRRYSQELGTMRPTPCGMTIHLFGLSYLSKLQDNFFSRIAKDFPVAYYLISPTQMFWSDIVSDRERRSIGEYWEKKGASEQERIELDEYLRDRNPLLANFGRLGREMASLIETSNAEIVEQYLLPESVLDCPLYQEGLSEDNLYYATNGNLSILQAVQSDMLLLRSPSTTDEIHFLQDDATIQVHSAPSRLREVQVIYDLILSLIHRHQGEINPSDFIVMSPNIMEYVPYIRAIFHDKESLLDAQIMDVNLPAKNPIVQGFLHLLNLASSRWDSVTLLELLDFIPFQRKHHLVAEDIHTLRKWMKESGVRWGINGKHRDQLLKKSHCSQGMAEKSEIGTLEYGTDRLLAGMVYAIGKHEHGVDDLNVVPMDGVETSQADLLSTWIGLIEHLKSDLEPLCDGSLMTFEDWTNYLQRLYETYFSADSEDHEEQLLALFSNFRQIAKELPESQLLFSTIKHHIEAHLNKETTSYRETHLHAVKFFSMLAMRAIPVKAIILMGMEEGSFPKPEHNLSLNLIKAGSGADYFPSQIDFDRYLFLEILLSARQYFIMTYQNRTSLGVEESAPSLPVTELIDYLDKYYHLPVERTVYHHPFYSFDKSYFEENCRFRSFSHHNYKLALAHYHPEKEDPHTFVADFHQYQTEIPLESTSIALDIKKLKGLAREPLKHYLTQRFGIYLDKDEDREIKNEEDFSLSHLNKIMLSREGLIQPLVHVKRSAVKEGKLPFGIFKDLATSDIKEEYQKLNENIVMAGANPQALFTIDCHLTCPAPHIDEEGNWNLPPLEIKLDEAKTIKLIGRIPLVASQGLVAHVKDTLDEVMKAWPEYLFFIALIHHYQLPIEGRLLCSKSGVCKNPYVGDSIELLRVWIRYYLLTLKTPSPLLPGWINFFIQEDHQKLKTQMNSDFNGSFTQFYDEYAKWVICSDFLPDTETLVDQWKATGRSILGDMPDQWYQKKKAAREVE